MKPTQPDQHDAAARLAGRTADAWRRPLCISREETQRLDANEPAPLALNRDELRRKHAASASPARTATILPPKPEGTPRLEAERADAAPQYREGDPIPFELPPELRK